MSCPSRAERVVPGTPYLIFGYLGLVSPELPHPNSLPVRNRLAGEGIRHQGREAVKGVALRA